MPMAAVVGLVPMVQAAFAEARPEENQLGALQPLAEGGRQVVTVVRIPSPWWAPRFVVKQKLRAARPDYVNVPGLLRKAFTLSARGEFGGIYLWESRAAAQAWFNDRWHARVTRTYGADTEVLFLDAPQVVEGAAAEPEDTAVAVWLAAAPGDERGLDELWRSAQGASELVRVMRVQSAASGSGVIALFATSPAAKAWLASRAGATATVFDAPALLTTAGVPFAPAARP